jgi:hypothetical protein
MTGRCHLSKTAVATWAAESSLSYEAQDAHAKLPYCPRTGRYRCAACNRVYRTLGEQAKCGHGDGGKG